MDPGKTETATSIIYKDENGVIHIVIKEGVRMDYFDALDHYLIIKNLSGATPVLKLIDARCNWSMQAKARKFLAGKEVKEKTIARAIVQNSAIRKALVNFFYVLNKRSVPTKLFTDRAAAYAWLMQMKGLQG